MKSSIAYFLKEGQFTRSDFAFFVGFYLVKTEKLTFHFHHVKNMLSVQIRQNLHLSPGIVVL